MVGDESFLQLALVLEASEAEGMKAVEENMLVRPRDSIVVCCSVGAHGRSEEGEGKTSSPDDRPWVWTGPGSAHG